MEKTSKYLIILVAVLVLISGMQSFFLFKLYHKNKTNMVEETTEIISTVPPRSTRQLDPQPQIQATPKPSQTPNSIQQWPFRGFDNNSKDWDPFAEMQQMREHMNQMFQHSLNRFNTSPLSKNFFDSSLKFSPNVDIQETNEDYVVQLDLPGMDKASIDIKIEDRILTISGTRKEEKEEKEDDKFYRQERSYGKFSRTITLPGPVNDNELKAEYINGVLTVIIPKAKETSPPKKIPII